MTSYQPGTYVRGSEEREADTPARAVALVFDGFRPKAEQVEESAEDAVDNEPEDTDTPYDERDQDAVSDPDPFNFN